MCYSLKARTFALLPTLPSPSRKASHVPCRHHRRRRVPRRPRAPPRRGRPDRARARPPASPRRPARPSSRRVRTAEPHERGRRTAGRGAHAPRPAAGRGAGGRLCVLVPRLARRDDRQHRVPGRARVVRRRDARRSLVDPERVRDHLRRTARARRTARRPGRGAAALPRRARGVHGRLGVVRLRAIRPVAGGRGHCRPQAERCSSSRRSCS